MLSRSATQSSNLIVSGHVLCCLRQGRKLRMRAPAMFNTTNKIMDHALNNQCHINPSLNRPTDVKNGLMRKFHFYQPYLIYLLLIWQLLTKILLKFVRLQLFSYFSLTKSHNCRGFWPQYNPKPWCWQRKTLWLMNLIHKLLIDYRNVYSRKWNSWRQKKLNKCLLHRVHEALNDVKANLR